MDEDIDSLNKVLRSLVISTPTQVDVSTLLRDYKTMVGKTLPISKFGYKDPVLFLKEKCSDSFVLQGPTPNPVLVLIQNNSIKHIDKLVQKQRFPSSNKLYSKGKQRSVCPPPPVHHHVQNKYKADSVPYNVSQQNLYKTRTAPFNSRRSSSEKSTHDRDSRAGDDSGRQTLSSTRSSKRTPWKELKQQVSDIISDHPEGVWATDLVGLYRERYQCELDFGFSGILSLVYMLEHMNVSHQPNGDWLLSDARAPPPLRPQPPVRRHVPPPVDPDDALPGIPYAADVYPEDCLNFLESIPSPSFANVEPGGMLEVAVGEVYSPSHFWLFRLGDDHNIAMENIIDEMNQYYKHGEGKDRRLSRVAARVGQYCSSCFEGEWHRSLIVKIVDSDTVKDDSLEVLLIDTSTSEDKSITDELIRSGNADRRQGFIVGTSECYLFPRFAALESADTPNFSEIHAYLRGGIDLECVADYRRHVLFSLLAPRVTPPLDPLTPASASPSPTTCSPAQQPLSSNAHTYPPPPRCATL